MTESKKIGRIEVELETNPVKPMEIESQQKQLYARNIAAISSHDWLDDGQKFKIVITLDCRLVTNELGATKNQIRDIMFNDPAYGLKSIVVGTINPNSQNEHDTEILWDNTTIEVV